MSSSISTIKHVGMIACIFLILSLPQLYIKSNEFLSEEGICPTYKSRLLHLLIFYVLAYICLRYLVKSEKDFVQLTGYIFYAALLYFLISSPDMYKLTDSIIGLFNTNPTVEPIKFVNDSCPTIYGIITHTLIYLIIFGGWNYFSKEDIDADKD